MNLTAQLPALLVAVPMLAAPIVALLRVRGLPWAATVAASFMTFAIAISLTLQVMEVGTIVYDMGSWPAPYGIELRFGAFGALVLLIVTGASSVALLAGRRTLAADIETDREPLFFAAWLLALGGLSGIVVSGDAFNIFVFMEISSLATYIVIAGGRHRKALSAVFKYLVMGTIGATFYLIGVGLIYMMTGTLNLADMQVRLADVTELRPILVAAGFVTVGLALKAAVFPLHVWLPNAYTYAPHAVTAFVAACSTKVSLYVLLRFDFTVFQDSLTGHDIRFAGFLMPLAVLAAVVGAAVAVFERDLKRLLAYSSVGQIGYILLGASFLSATGLTAGIVHMFNHALAKGSLFLAVMAFGLRYARLDLASLAGAGRAMPWTMAAFVLAGLSLIGVPGTAGFIGKWYLIQAALAEGPLGIAIIAIVLGTSLLAVAYIWRVVEVAYFGEPSEPTRAPTEAPAMVLAVLWTAALGNLYFGLWPTLPLSLADAAATTLLERPLPNGY